ncbi:MAG: hypothetical protein C0610_06015 [Desulfobacteraceae bacterium]|nr:MAG: hypothetical protein C0610_06015 [Desulfobacteraceae bacterium]
MDFLLGFAGYGGILIVERSTLVTHLITNITEKGRIVSLLCPRPWLCVRNCLANFLARKLLLTTSPHRIQMSETIRKQ